MIEKCCDDCPGDDTCEHAEVCMCGSYMAHHGMYDGHSPVSMHHYHCTPVAEYPPESSAPGF